MGQVTLSECRITARDVQRDVEDFARNVIDAQLPNKDVALRAELMAQMAASCDGMFLWVRLQQRRLRAERNRRQLQGVVRETPPGLDRLYDTSRAESLRLERADVCRTLAMLRWTMFALRPLTVLELTHALVVPTDEDDGEDNHASGCNGFPLEDLPDEVDKDYVDDQIIDICPSLVEARNAQVATVTVSSDTIHIVHFSVRQYLLAAAPPQGLPAIDSVSFSHEAAQHAHLACLCLRYLNFGNAWEKSGSESPFLGYAARTWHQHARFSAKGGDETVTGLVNRLFDATNPRWEPWRDYFKEPLSKAAIMSPPLPCCRRQRCRRGTGECHARLAVVLRRAFWPD
jgi:hypothetical protein